MVISGIRVICSICVGTRIFLVFLGSWARRISFRGLGTVTDISVGSISIYTIRNSHFYFLPVDQPRGLVVRVSDY